MVNEEGREKEERGTPFNVSCAGLHLQWEREQRFVKGSVDGKGVKG